MSNSGAEVDDWEPPRRLQQIEKWTKSALSAGTFVSWIVGLYATPEASRLAFYFAAGVVTVGVIIIIFANPLRFFESLSIAQRIAENPRDLSKAKRAILFRQLSNYRVLILASFIGTLFLLFIIVWLAGSRMAYEYLYRKIPSEVNWEEVSETASDVRWLQTHPWLNALRVHLEFEGKAGNETSRVLKCEAKNFTHPTPDLSVTLTFRADEHGKSINEIEEGHKYRFVGYAFIKRRGDGWNCYEEIAVTHQAEDRIKLSLPSCHEGDKIFLLLRLSLVKATEFPQEYKSMLVFSEQKEENKR